MKAVTLVDPYILGAWTRVLARDLTLENLCIVAGIGDGRDYMIMCWDVGGDGWVKTHT